MEHPTVYRTVQVDGLSIFYREAGPKNAPTILLLHGLPSSSRMFQPLLTRLADRYHLVAPDYPGYGHSDWPDPKQFDYTFDHIASVMDSFTNALGGVVKYQYDSNNNMTQITDRRAVFASGTVKKRVIT